MVLQGTITKVDRRECAKIPPTQTSLEVSLLLCACVTLQIFFRFYYFTLFTKFKHYCTLFTENILIKIRKKRNQKRKCSVTNIFSFSHRGSEKFCSLFNHRRHITRNNIFEAMFWPSLARPVKSPKKTTKHIVLQGESDLECNF